MSNTTIRGDGRVTYRTKLFVSLDKARSFAKCISSNTRCFEGVLVHSSTKSSTPKWFVTFLPANVQRQDDIYDAQQKSRSDRAVEQNFIFWPHDNYKDTFWCYSVLSGETYEVTHNSCTCPDFQYRCSNSGIRCKHIIACVNQKNN